MKILATLLLTIIFSVNLLAGTIDPSVPDEKYINYGQKFDYVYKVCGTYENGKLFGASSVVINDKWALTAAHVIENARTVILHKNNKAHLADEIIIHKDFNIDNFGIADIALIKIKDSFDLKFYPPLYDNDKEINKVCCIAGYGLHGTFNTGVKDSDDNIRAGSNIIDRIEKDLLICSPSIGVEKTELEYIICSGDSGGGLFIDGKLAGINSCVLAGADRKPNSNYGDEAGHTRISKFLPWILEHIKNHD